MNIDIDSVLEEIKKQTEKFGGLRGSNFWGYGLGASPNNLGFDYADIVKFAGSHDLSPKEIASEFIQKVIYEEYFYLKNGAEYEIKPKVFYGSLEEKYEIGQKIFGDKYKIKYFLEGEFFYVQVDKIVLEFMGLTEEEFLKQAKEAKIKPIGLITHQKNGALILKTRGENTLNSILDARFIDRIAKKLDSESFICLLNDSAKGIAIKWSEIKDVVTKDGYGSDSSKIKDAIKDIADFNYLRSHVFYCDSKRGKVFSVNEL